MLSCQGLEGLGESCRVVSILGRGNQIEEPGTGSGFRRPVSVFSHLAGSISLTLISF